MNLSADRLDKLKQAVIEKRLKERIKLHSAQHLQDAIVPASRQKSIPLSWPQQRLWFLHQFDPTAADAYHIPASLMLEGKLNIAVLKKAFDHLIDRHEVLRTRFVERDKQPVQIIEDRTTGFDLIEHHLHNFTEDKLEHEISRICYAEVREPFDLKTGPLIRGRLLHLSEDKYILLITQHHIISDAWSVGILISEISRLYLMLTQGQNDGLTPLPIQYADYAVWQRQRLQGDRLKKQLDYWCERLSDAPALLELPLDRPRPKRQTYNGGRISLKFNKRLYQNLQLFCKQFEVTPFMALLTAWAILLYRLTGQDDFVIGTPVANRPRKEIEALIGFFVNTLALRVPVKNSSNVTDLLGEVKRLTLEAYNYQELPFEKIVEIINPQRSVSYSPIFQTLISLDNTQGHDKITLSELQVTAMEPAYTGSQFDLAISLNIISDTIEGYIEYASDLFDECTIERYTAYYLNIVESMLADDRQLIERIPLIDDLESQKLLVGFNKIDANFPLAKTVKQKFESIASIHKDNAAVTFNGQELNYNDLNRHANRLAHYLIDLGIKPDQRVALCTQRSLETVIGILGILKAGGAYVPMDPDYPLDRLSFMLKDSEPMALLSQAMLKEKLPQTNIPILILDDPQFKVTLSKQSDKNPESEAIGLQSKHLAYVIYTSGSTGQPKGVMVEHGNLISSTEARIYCYKKYERCLQIYSPAFDGSIADMFGTLLSGGSLYMLDQTAVKDPRQLCEAISHYKITTILCVPSMAKLIVQNLLGVKHCLKEIIVAGEVCPPGLLKLVKSLSKDIQLYNEYGPTEGTVWCTQYHYNDSLSGPVPIGQPIANSRVYILDRQLQTVPIGVKGELYIGGSGVSRGYINRHDLTQERYIQSPFNYDKEDRLYKTGDLARWLADGNIEYLGRNDDQVKLRGYRIELGEIEAQLYTCQAIEVAAVRIHEDRLLAYIVAKQAALCEISEIRNQLSKQLPDFMIPNAFVMLDALPLTPNGKLDVNALPLPDQNSVAKQKYVEPKGQLEKLIADIWQVLLNLQAVGRFDHFFDLGGHSLLAVQLISRLRDELHVEITIPQLFENPVLCKFAAIVGRAQQSGLFVINKADRKQALPATWQQKRLWFLNQLDQAASIAYHIPAGIRLSGALNRNALKAALHTIVERHEALRTIFKQVDDNVIQVVSAVDLQFQLDEKDLSSLEEQQQPDSVIQYCEYAISAPFDLSRGPLVRGLLLKLREAEHILIVIQHHIISDGWSIGILSREIADLYTAYSQGQENPLTPLTIQYADYAAWQQSYFQGEVLDTQKNYWCEQLKSAPPLLELPTDYTRPSEQSYRGSAVSFKFPDGLSESLRVLSQQQGVTLFMTLFAAWSVLMSRLSGQKDIVVGTPIANRQHSELEPLIGFFVNTLALRVSFLDNLSVEDLLRLVKKTTLNGYRFQDLPFEQIVEIIQPARSLSYSPVFQVMFSLNNTPHNQALNLPGLTLTPIGVDQNTTQFDLSMSLSEHDEGIRGALEYASDLFSHQTVERFIAYYLNILQAMVDTPTQAVFELPILSRQEHDRLLYDFNDTGVCYPNKLTIHQLFEREVELYPDHIAVQFEQEQLSYSELNWRSNQIAHFLQNFYAIRPDDRVALCMERSVEMVIGLLGILKAGAAYVPIDPAYPADRIAYVLEDSQPKVLLAQDALRKTLYNLGDKVEQYPIILLDEAKTFEEIGKQDINNIDVSINGLTVNHLAYVIYTSGSTGQPKGVMNQHDGVVNRLKWAQDQYQFGPDDSVLQKTPFGFDVSVWEFFLPLISGGRLVIARPQGHQDPHYLEQVIQEYGITTIHFVPSMLRPFLHQEHLDRCRTLKRVLCSGEELPYKMLRRFTEVLPEVELHNLYGPTEAAIDVTSWKCLIDTYSDKVPIGRPIANTQIYILDEYLQLVPPGVVGEIYIGGAGVARGYLNRQALTEERFISNPFHEDSNGQLYKTGDLGRWLLDGNIEFVGRNDFQVKIRGFRIELGEIEARLVELNGVDGAVVLASQNGSEDKRLIAYIASKEPLSSQQLREQLVTRLPEYMIPNAYIVLKEFPLNLSGKVDRSALPCADEASVISREYQQPEGALEILLADTWSELLGVDRVGRNDHFFELGGHSLLIITLIERIRKLGWCLDVKTVFTAPTLSAMANNIAQHSHAVQTLVPENLITQDCKKITPELLPLISLTQEQIENVIASMPQGMQDIQDIYPLSPLQEGVLFQHLLYPDESEYIQRYIFSFDSTIKLNQFLAGLQAVIDRHDILRSSVHWEGLPQALQVVHRNAKLTTQQVFDISSVEQFLSKTDPKLLSLDLCSAPLLLSYTACDSKSGDWYLALLNHHLVCDHLTLELITEEIQMIMQDEFDQLPNPLPYRNFIAHLQADLREQQEAYFRQQLSDVEEPTMPFGISHYRSAEVGSEEVRLNLCSNLSKNIRRNAGNLGVSPAVLFHVAWAQVLSKCTGKSDVVMGAMLSGRTQGSVGADQVLGMFMNTLPLRIKLNDSSVIDVIKETYKNLSELLRHEQAPLSLAQSCSGVQSPLPLFTTLFNYRHSKQTNSIDNNGENEILPGIRFLKFDEYAHYPILLSVDDFGRDFSLTALTVEGIDANRIITYMETAIRELIYALHENPRKKISLLNIIGAKERKLILEKYNDTRDLSLLSEFSGKFIHQEFESQAKTRSNDIAVVYQNDSLSYRELNIRANQLAHYLRSLGLGPDDRVAICMERSLELVISILGVMKSGCTYVPMDPAYPCERLSYMLEDSGPGLILTQSIIKRNLQSPVFSRTSSPVLVMDNLKDLQKLSNQDRHNIDVKNIGLEPEDCVYIIYTSGSTGRPKGVLAHHKGYSNLLLWYKNEFGFDDNDRVLIVSSFSFDLTQKNYLACLLSGGQLHLSKPQFDPVDIVKIVKDEKISLLNLTPSAFYAIVDEETGHAFDYLRYVFLGGEPINMDSIIGLRTQYPDLEIVNTYGPTECTDVVAYYRLDKDWSKYHALQAPIGRPIANTQIYILDQDLNPVPVGVSGELYIGGIGVTHGYLNNENLNSVKFIDDPFSESSNARLYKTGDLGRYVGSGNIEFQGRNDFQVKIRGFRIELGEIETALRSYNGIRDAVVVADKNNNDLIGYFISESGLEIPVESLREYLCARLPNYMVPGILMSMQEFPLTPSGKLDRKALPEAERSTFISTQYKPPQNLAERNFADIWKNLLGLEQVGRDDHFFELGGQSLLVMQLISRLRADYNIGITIYEVFENPVLKDMVKISRGIDNSDFEIIPTADRQSVLPLSLAQQRLWFLDQLDHAASVAYHLPGGVYLNGELNYKALKDSLDQVMSRHEILRTSFIKKDGEPIQQIAPCDCGFDLRQEDLSMLSRNEQQFKVMESSRRETQKPFELDKGPMVRGLLIKLSADKHILMLTQHHIISDGWSIGILIREISVLYEAFVQGLQDPLPPLPVQYADYAAWQRAWLQGERLQMQQAYWKSVLGSAPALLELPIDYPRPASQSYRGGRVTIQLPLKLTSVIRQLSRQQNVTLYMTLLAAWSILLCRLSRQKDIVIGTPVANRQRKESESLIGFFVNTLALRIDLNADPNITELLNLVKKVTLAAHKHQDIPFEQVVELVQPKRSLSYSPIIQTMFTLDNIPTSGDINVPNLTLSPLDAAHCTTHFDLSLSLSDSNDLISGYFEYSSDLFDQNSIQRFAKYYVNILEAIADDIDQTVAGIRFIDQDELHCLLFEYNNTQADYENENLIHRLFENQVNAAPGETALTLGDLEISYQELNERANQLAHFLLDLGVKPDDCVALCMERSFELLIAILGVLKSGAAYVPFDPDYPSERLKYLLSDCQPLALLTKTAYEGKISELGDACKIIPCYILDKNKDLKSLSKYPRSNIKPEQIGLDPSHLAYIIYTSGSTGHPKGVMVEHRNVVQQAVNQADIKLSADDCLAYCANPAFDASSWEIWSGLLNGARLAIVAHDVLLDPMALSHYLQTQSVNILQLTAGLFGQYAYKLTDSFSKLKYLLFGGDQADLSAVKHVYKYGKPMHLMHTYGPTETVAFTVCCEVGEELLRINRLPIGRAITNTYVYILDEQLQAVPIGVVGEIYIGGVGVARGYLNQPELSKDRFIDNPYIQNKGGRLYKTGDLARWSSAGNIEFLGRSDSQVKIRGFRIELGEIESQLNACSGVNEAIVLAQESDSGDKELLAYLAASDGLSIGQLKEQLNKQLPDYMIPNAFIMLPAFPLTPNGKVDRSALPKYDQNSVATKEYVEPCNETEILIANIWKDLLNLERVGSTDHFFELGGHSLLIISFIERMRQNGLHLDVRSVFLAPVLSDMAKAVLNKKSDRGMIIPENLIGENCKRITPELLPLVKLSQNEIDTIVASVDGGISNIQDIYPLAPLQEGILFHHLLNPESDPYLLRSLISFENRDLLDEFLSALQSVIDRHDILRSAVHWHGLLNPLQVVQRSAVLSLEEFELHQGRDSLEQLKALSDPCKLRLDLTVAPLLRAYIAKSAHSNKWYMSLLHHHIVSDHVTLDFIIHEIYLITKGLSNLLPASLPYRNFIAQARSIPVEDHEAYFKEQLSDLYEPTVIFSVNDVQGNGDNIQEANLDLTDELNIKIRQQAKKYGVSAAVIFHVAWAKVLSFCSNRSDVVMGTVLSGRSQGSEGADQVLGMFINTLPLRIKIQGRSVEQIVQDAYQGLSLLLVHEQASLALAQRCSGIPESMPLFTTLFNYIHNTNDTSDEFSQASENSGMKLLESEERTNYPIMLSVNDDYQSFNINAQCIDKINPEQIIEYMNLAIYALVDALENEPGQGLEQLNILPEHDRDYLLKNFNGDEIEYQNTRSIHELFEKQVALKPNKRAVTFGEFSLSYQQLNEQANQIAHYLLTLNLDPEFCVAVCLERGLNLLIALLGILKAGGCYLPLDPSLPKERLCHMLSDSASVLIIADTDLNLGHSKIPILLLNGTSSLIELAKYSKQNPISMDFSPNKLAYLIYTSGSTGRPKGVMVEHGNVINFLNSMSASPGIDPDDALLAVTTISFDIAGLELYLPLINGAELVLASRYESNDPKLLQDKLGKHHITIMQATPATWHMLLESGWSGDKNLKVLCGGEALNQLLAQRLYRCTKEVWNLYGPTETTIWSSIYKVEPNLEISNGSVSIGRPIANTQIYILGEYKQLLPIGVVGEIYIGGAGVSRGYINQTELTADRFIQNPYDASGRIYKTGDLARWLPDGYLEYLGRNDEQIKLRGFRIELGEIESNLVQFPGILQGIVLLREDEFEDKRLCAYIKSEKEINTDELREYLNQRLPAYMIPNVYINLPEFPQTHSGKVDKRALPLPDQSSVVVQQYVPVQGECEEAIAVIWQDLLNIDRIGRLDHFFELGGHSLIAVQLMSRLRSLLNVEVALHELFSRPILRDFAKAVEKAERIIVEEIVKADRDQSIPLSWSQQRLWFIDKLDPAASIAYHIPAGLRMKGSLNQQALKLSLDRIVERHEILRTTFIEVDGQAIQNIGQPDQGFNLIEHDLSDLGKVEQTRKITRLSKLEASEPFNLHEGPLVRGRLLKLHASEYILLLTQHHIISDGWSIGVLIRELSQLYGAFSQGQNDPLPDLKLQYADFSVWQRNNLQGKGLQKQLSYWLRQLDGVPALLELPSDHARQNAQSYRGGRVSFEIDDEISVALKKMSGELGVTPFMTLFSAWSVLMSRLSGQNDIVIGSPTANRQHSDIEPLIGFFVNTLALRVSLDGNPVFKDFVQQVKQVTLDAYSHQDIPFEQVVEALKPERSLSHSPVFQVLFVFNNIPDTGKLVLPDLNLFPLEIKQSTTQFDLTISLFESDKEIYGSVEYSSDLFEQKTIKRYVRYFKNLLKGLVDHINCPVLQLPLIDDDEKAGILHFINKSENRFVAKKCIHRIFEGNVLNFSSKTALVYKGERLNYRELNERSNQWARELIDRGIGPNDFVGLSVERSINMVVALLGILKAGGAYVPLDRKLPKKRLEYIINNANISHIIINSSGKESLKVDSACKIVLDDPQIASVLKYKSKNNLAINHQNPSQSVYLLYTSGSTGQPKGVDMPHSAVVNLVQQLALAHGKLPSNFKWLQYSTIGFDMAFTDIFMNLCLGGELHIIDERTQKDIVLLTEYIMSARITCLNFPAVVLKLFVQYAEEKQYYFENLKLIISTAERLKLTNEIYAFFKRHNHCQLINEYGPTETHVVSTYIVNESDKPNTYPSIGKPIGNVQCYVLNSDLELQPYGVIGELYIGGACLAKEYLNMPELTNERFIKNPFSNADRQDRLYKTGDLVRYLPNGNLEYVGRADFQVKLRGFRIELGEIENRLGQYTSVSEAVVLLRQNRPEAGHAENERLTAYIRTKENIPISGSELQAYLREDLPEYMIPSEFVFIDKIPLTPNGKLDRQALPVPDQSSIVLNRYVAPQSGVETAVAKIWQDLLDIERVGREDNFFDLGGHSILAVQMVAKIRSNLGADLALHEIFAAPILKDFVKAISDQANTILVPISASGHQKPLFFIHAGGGGVAYAGEISPYINKDVPIYGIGARGFVLNEEPLSSVEEMASLYIEEIFRIQNKGPYRIAGWSFGGIVAYEIAKQLMASGEQVEFLGLIDAEYRRELVRLFDGMSMGDTILWQLDEDVPEDIRMQLESLAVLNKIPEMLAICQSAELLPKDIDIDCLQRHLTVEYNINQAIVKYHTEPVAVPAVMFSARDENHPDASNGWQALLGENLSFKFIPGNHQTIVRKPCVEELGRALDDALSYHKESLKRINSNKFFDPLVVIQEGKKSAVPMFCIPGAGANVTVFNDLAITLGTQTPIYGLQPRGHDNHNNPFLDVLSAVDSYFPSIKKVVKNNACLLLGHSYGAWVAFELAVKLRSMGIRVESLLLLDADIPKTVKTGKVRYTRLQVLLKLVELYEQKLEHKLNLSEDKLGALKYDQQIELLLKVLIEHKLLSPSTDFRVLRNIVHVYEANINTDYMPNEVYTKNVHLINALSNENVDSNNFIRFWRRYAPKATYTEVEGNHMTMLSVPHVMKLSGYIKILISNQSNDAVQEMSDV